MYSEFGGDLDEETYRYQNEKVLVRNYQTEMIARESAGLPLIDLVKGVDSDFQENEIDDSFGGVIDTENDPNPKREYKDLVARVGFENALDLTQNEKDKAILLIKCARMASFLVELERRFKEAGKFYIGVDVPGQDIYQSGIFLPENRGKILKNAGKTGSNNLGIMTGNMPVARDDKIFTEHSFEYLKPAEMATYNLEAEWVKNTMKQLVHPFVNGVSGTVYIQLRMLAALAHKEKLTLNRKTIKPYMILLISCMGSMSGGHSLVEFVGTFQLEQVKSFLKIYSQDTLIEGLNLQTMFYDDNLPAFEATISAAIKYNNKIIDRKKVNIQINAISN